MGLSVEVDAARPLGEALERLAVAGAPSTVVMIDGALVMPGAPVPATWSDIRLKTPAGTFALKRRGSSVAIVAFGNADDAARAMQARIASALHAD